MTFDEACAAQDEYWKKYPNKADAVRTFSMKPEFTMREQIHMGTGVYSMNIHTREAHHCQMQWNAAGTVLLCTICHYDGT